MLTRRTPMKRTSWPRRVAPATPVSPVQPLARPANYASAAARAPARSKSTPLRSEAYRRAVAAMPCIHCGIAGHSQHAHANEGKGMGIKRTPFKRKNNAENIQSKVAQSHAQQALGAIINIAKSAKKRAFNAVGCSESPKQSTCMRGFHA